MFVHNCGPWIRRGYYYPLKKEDNYGRLLPGEESSSKEQMMEINNYNCITNYVEHACGVKWNTSFIYNTLCIYNTINNSVNTSLCFRQYYGISFWNFGTRP
uniref:Uncharacterized protein n=1 Tax=Cacopsylla melanoneura TaxID=428564 RepID=A0A8D8QQQ2_9HEMI